MTMRFSSQLKPFGIIVGLAILVVLAMDRWNSKRAAAQTATANVEACRQLAMQIANLKARPSRAALESRSTTDFTQRVEKAAQNAGLAQDSILRIDPQPARRVEDTTYLEQPTTLELRDISLQHLTTFLLALTADDSSPIVSALRLTVPRQQATRGEGEPWHAEVTLTHLIFSPETPQFQR